MAVTTMHPTNTLLEQIKKDFPRLHFAPGDIFYWSSQNATLYYGDIKQSNATALLLHELAHALLGHTHYTYDIELLRLETAAWETAIHILAPKYTTTIKAKIVEKSLNSYQHWLFERSTCPDCYFTGAQQTKNTYQCINCRCSWRVNDAKLCALRRTKF